MTGSAPASTLEGWEPRRFPHRGALHRYYEKGRGPGVVVLPELPGIGPELLGLAQHLVDSGFTVVIPSLFGRDGAPGGPIRASLAIARCCISREFRAFATNAHRPVADYLCALANELNGRTPGPGVGVVGLCFTGGFALAAAVDDSVLAAAMSEPSLPVPLTPTHRSDPGVSAEELAQTVARAEAGDLCVLGLRFSEDRFAPRQRFQTLKDHLGDAFTCIQLRSGSGTDFSRCAHSVLTHEVRETAGHPALQAREELVTFLKDRLAPPP